jgi:hypothetical protein
MKVFMLIIALNGEKKLRRAEEGANILGVFRVKNHYLMPKKPWFLQLRREARTILGYFVV